MSQIKNISALAVLAMGCFVIGCGPTTDVPAGVAPPPSDGQPTTRTYDFTHKLLDNATRNAGQYWTVAILRFGDTRQVDDVPFGDKADAKDPGGGEVNVNVKVIGQQNNARRPSQDRPQMNKRARELLKHALVESDAFTVIERERILEILREVNFGKTKYVDPASAPDEGKLLCVRYLIEGSLGANEDRTLKGTLDAKEDYRDVADYEPGLLRNIFTPRRANHRNRMIELQKLRQRRFQNKALSKFNIACYLSAYEVGTGQVKVSVMGLGTNGLEAIEDAVEELIGELTDKDDGLRVAAVVGEKVYLDIGAKGGIEVGQRFRIVHLGKEIRNRHGVVLGHEESERGEIEVTETRDMLSVAKVVTKAGTIARGDLAKPAKTTTLLR